MGLFSYLYFNPRFCIDALCIKNCFCIEFDEKIWKKKKKNSSTLSSSGYIVQSFGCKMGKVVGREIKFLIWNFLHHNHDVDGYQ